MLVMMFPPTLELVPQTELQHAQICQQAKSKRSKIGTKLFLAKAQRHTPKTAIRASLSPCLPVPLTTDYRSSANRSLGQQIFQDAAFDVSPTPLTLQRNHCSPSPETSAHLGAKSPLKFTEIHNWDWDRH
jgi:hypothetical protein